MLGKIARDKLEAAKVTLRGHRADTIKEIDAAEKAGEMSQDEQKRYKDEVQKFVDKSGEALEALTKKKEAELAA
jgi:ribosome recycling factor